MLKYQSRIINNCLQSTRYMKRGTCLYAHAHTHALYMIVSYQIKFPKSSSTLLICVKVPVIRFKYCADLRLLEVSNFIGTLDTECIMKMMYYEDMKTNLILIWIVDEKYFWPILYILNIVDIRIIKKVCNVHNTDPKNFISYMCHMQLMSS